LLSEPHSASAHAHKLMAFQHIPLTVFLSPLKCFAALG